MARNDPNAFEVPDPAAGNSPVGLLPIVGPYWYVSADRGGPLRSLRVVHSIPGRVRLRVPMLQKNPHLARGIEALLSAQAGVIQATVNTGCHSLTVVYDSAMWTEESLCIFLRDRGRDELEECASVAKEKDDGSPSSTNSLEPWRFLNVTASAPGSEAVREPVKSVYWRVGYASMVVGTILLPVPLLPGIPFLMLSSYCFAKATVWKDEEGAAGGQEASKAKE